MQNNVFTPLGMNNTFIFSVKDTANYKPSFGLNNLPIALEAMDCIYGDKNVYSTPRDMLRLGRCIVSVQVCIAGNLRGSHYSRAALKDPEHIIMAMDGD